MDNRWDEGIQEDFNNMTAETGNKNVIVYPREESLTYEGQEGPDSGEGDGRQEIAFLQELNTSHDIVSAGIMKVGDVRIVFQHDTIADVESYIRANARLYKIMEINFHRGMSGDHIVDVRGYGKRIPGR